MSGALFREPAEARAWLRQWPRCTVVAPTRRAADAFVREAALEAPVVGVARRSIRQWLHEGAPQVRLTPLARRAELARLAAGMDFEWFGEVAESPGFAVALDRTIDELRRFEIAPEQLEAEGPGGRDLARVLRAYEAEHGGVDDVDALRAASPPGGPHLFLDVAPEDPVTERFIEAARRQGPWAALETAMDKRAEAFWRRPAPEVATSEAEGEGSGSHPDLVIETSARVDFASVANTATEATEVARWLLKQADTHPFDRMAILLRHPTHQQAPLAAALERAEIPCFFARGVRRPHPAGRAMLALLRCGEEGLSASRFAEYLSFGQVPEPEPDGAWRLQPSAWVPPGDDGQLVFVSTDAPTSPTPRPEAAVAHGGLDTLRRWERWITDAAVVGGIERWRRRLDGLEAEWTRMLNSAVDHAGRDGLERDLASLGHLRSFALPIVEDLTDWATPRSLGAWMDRLERLARRALRSAEPVLAVLNELSPLRQRPSIEAPELRALLTPPLGELREEPSSDPYGAVFVGTPEEAAGRRFDAVALPGLTEGRFPVALRGDPLLPEDARHRLHPDFPLRPRTRRAERRAFGIAVRSAPQLLLTYPRVAELDSENQVPSSFVLELWDAAHGLDADPLRAGPPRRAYGPGWRVPVDASEAVDETEYDVAVAAALDELGPGAARYLLTEDGNAHLRRALRARYARGLTSVGPSDGLWTDDPRLRAWLSERRPAARVQSATALESFAACPLRYWMHAVLRLRPRVDPTHPDVLNPLTKGSIFHEILFELQQLEPRADRMPSRVADVVRRVAGRWFDELCPALPAVYWKTIDEIEDDVRGWVRRAAERPEPRETAAAELGFGLPGSEGRDPASRAEALSLASGHRFRGSVDRVERDVEGRLHVVDFKSGKVPDHPFGPTSGGRQLQPLLYAEAAEQILGAPVASATLSYATRRAGFFEQPPLWLTAEERRAELFGLLELIDGQHEAGSFIPRPEPEGCRWCDYLPSCGPGEEKRSRLKKDEDGRAFERLEAVRARS